MNASNEPRRRRPRTLRWAVFRGLAFLALLALCACSDSAAGADAVGEDVADRGMNPMPDPDCELVQGEQCFDDAADRCPLVRQLIIDQGCVDEDGDCFVTGCDVDPGLLDCDDRLPEINPQAAERCDLVDHDCDGQPQNGYDGIGAACALCGRDGKLECAVDDPFRLTCSVMAGQSGALDPLPEELCDGADGDCDGRIDEGCRIDSPPGARLATPAVCFDGTIAVIEDGALVLYGGPAGAAPSRTELRPAARRPMFPDCGPTGVAWLEASGDLPCIDAPGGPLTCLATLWFAPWAEAPRAVVDPADDIGPPRVVGEMVTWHRVVRDLPSVLSWLPGGDMAPRLVAEGRYSDPAPSPDGATMAVRDWADDEARITRLDLVDGGTLEVTGAEAGQDTPGPPASDGARLAWSGGGDEPVLWLVDERGGFRPVARSGPQRAPQLAGDMLVWFDESDGVSLRRFDLLTGDERAIAEGDIAVDGFDTRLEEVVWVERGPAGDRLLRQALPGFEPEPLPEPVWSETGEPAEPADAGVEVPDAGLDMAPEADAG